MLYYRISKILKQLIPLKCAYLTLGNLFTLPKWLSCPYPAYLPKIPKCIEPEYKFLLNTVRPAGDRVIKKFLGPIVKFMADRFSKEFFYFLLGQSF